MHALEIEVFSYGFEISVKFDRCHFVGLLFSTVDLHLYDLLFDTYYKPFSLICQPFILTFSDIFEKIYLTFSPFWFKITREVICMTARQIIEMGVAYAGITNSELARRLGWSPQLLNKRLNA